MADDDEISQLVRRARDGDAPAFDQLVRRFQQAIYQVTLRWLGDPAQAEDVTQEVLVHGWRKLGQLREPRCFGGWLRRIAVRLAINRMTRHRACDSLGADAVAATQPGPLEALLRAERRAAVHRGLERLKPLDRQTLVAFYLHGCSLRTMACQFRVSPGTIKSRLHTARARLRLQLERIGMAG
jgi:RNA polymerase sigma-70 factor (ECF subfamily)